MNGFRSLATRLAFYTLTPLVLLMLVASWMDNRASRKTMISMAETAAMNLSDSVREELQGILRSTRTGIEAFSMPLARLPEANTATVVPLLQEALARFPLIFGSTLAFDPATDGPEAPYLYRQDGQIVTTSLAGDDYRYWEWPWYRRPLEEGAPVWSAPYFDEGGGDVSMVTFSVPMVAGGRQAVLTADIRLGFLSEILASNLLGHEGVVFVFDDQGLLVSHPVESWVLDRDLGRLAKSLNIPSLAEVSPTVARGEDLWLRPESGIDERIVGGLADRPGRLYIRPLNEAGWGIAVYFSDQDFLSDINVATRNRLLFGLGIMLLLAAIMVTASYRSLQPLGALAARTRQIAQGDFSAETPGLDRKDEIGRLSRAFHQMQVHLEHYIDDLTRETAARERIEGELSTAKQIQASLVPMTAPDFGELPLDLSALLRPARAVGGDLYNYRMLDDSRLFFVIGDVSDKGVPAALFMAQANALLVAAAHHQDDPGDILNTVNEALCEDNEFCMFVTLMVGLLDTRDGSLLLANAAHDPPLGLDAHGQARWLDVGGGPPVGIDDTAKYQSQRYRLDPDDTLVLYTDGVTEALSPDDELFGDERLRAALAGHAPGNAQAVQDRLVTAVDHFCDGAPAADDLTLLVLRYTGDGGDRQAGPGVEAARCEGTLSTPVTTSAHHAVFDRVQAALDQAGNTTLDPGDVRLVVEEVLTNIVKYAGLGPDGRVDVAWSADENSLQVTFEDRGVAFDPLADRELTGNEDHSEGGMGLVLLQSLTDEREYTRLDGVNRLRLVFGST